MENKFLASLRDVMSVGNILVDDSKTLAIQQSMIA